MKVLKEFYILFKLVIIILSLQLCQLLVQLLVDLRRLVLTLYSVKKTLAKIQDENLAMHRSREIKHQFDLRKKQFAGFNDQFNIRYHIFRKYGDKIIGKMRNLAKRRSADREYVLKVFCKQEWEKLSPEKKSQHQLFNCNGSLNDIELKKALGFFLITFKFSKVVEEHGIVDNSRNKENDKENIKNNRTTAESVKKLSHLQHSNI